MTERLSSPEPGSEPERTTDPLAALAASIEATVAEYRAANPVPWRIRVIARERREAENRLLWRPMAREIRVRGGR